MNNLTSLLSQRHNSFNHKDAMEFIEQIEKAIEEMDKGCEYCDNPYCITCSNCLTDVVCATCKYHNNYSHKKESKYKHHNFCPNCGKDLRKEDYNG